MPFVTTWPNHIDIVRFEPQGALTALKRVYLVEKSLYLFSARKFLPYSIWDVTNTSSCRHNVLIVSYEIARPNKLTPPTGPNETDPHFGVGDRL